LCYTNILPVLELILKGIITGFILSIMIGPVFFILLETSIRKGFRAALSFDIGVILSDMIYIIIAYLFYSEVADLAQGSSKEIVKIIGGVVFIVFGLVYYFKRVKEKDMAEDGTAIKYSNDYFMLFLKGFILNMANPMVIFYWFSVMTLAEKNTDMYANETAPVFFFIGIILITFFSFDILKMLGAKKLRPLVTERVLIGINHFIGIVFLGFGVFLIANGIYTEV
jgi:threonine/homoserine/homoserine lactone efflux protein